MLKERLKPVGHRNQLAEVDSRFDAFAVQHVDQVILRDVARGVGSERAPANPAYRRV